MLEVVEEPEPVWIDESVWNTSTLAYGIDHLHVLEVYFEDTEPLQYVIGAVRMINIGEL